MEDTLKKIKWKLTSMLRQSYWDYLTTKTSKTNGFDTIEIDIVFSHFSKWIFFQKKIYHNAYWGNHKITSLPMVLSQICTKMGPSCLQFILDCAPDTLKECKCWLQYFQKFISYKSFIWTFVYFWSYHIIKKTETRENNSFQFWDRENIFQRIKKV